MSVPAGITGVMAFHWKLVIDARHAPTLAEFWAAALEYEVEDQATLIGKLLAAGQIPESAVTEHHGRRTFRGLTAIRHPDDPYDETTGIGQGRRILFQEVPEDKTVKNRLHIDIHSPDGLESLAARLESLGATRVREIDQGPAGHWWVMQDPEGNEFCAT
ncbi:VOC family protein [Actinophytocola sp.]|uniref:VOC family protein n=1 Tax=Actinophytocola sp. TaxID=1872138 RepID=UPI002D7EF17D|nr:VOC family protein [Actinophytocola sp.]HET9139679.1 VOC family protein [Actinophytocola sp.]